MMQIHKIVLTVLDFEDMGIDEVVNAIENARYPNRCINPQVILRATREIGAWSDDHPLNKAETAGAEINRLFSNEC